MPSSWSPKKLANVVLLAVVILAPARAVAIANLDPHLPFGMVAWVGLAAIVMAGALAIVGPLPGSVDRAALVVGAAVVAGLVALTTPSGPRDPSLAHHIGQLTDELAIWVRAVTSGHQATDNRLFLLLLCEVAWVLGYLSTWLLLRRQQVWLPVAAGILSVMLVLLPFPGLFGYAVVQILAALALAARVNLQHQRATWAIAGRPEPAALSRRAVIVGLPVSVALVGLGWLAPTTLAAEASAAAPSPIRNSWLKAQNEFYRLFGGLRAASLDSLSGFSSTLVLHGSFHLADTPVLQIAAALPLYWRAVVYDRYTGHGWLSGPPVENQSLPANTPLQASSARKNRAVLSQKVTVLQPRSSYLVGASEPVQFSRPATLQIFAGTTVPADILIAALDSKALWPGSQYTVTSQVPTATADQLREAGRDYPSDVRQRYLALPAIPRTVRRLASRLTYRATNAYDRASTVERYLKTLTYSLDVPVPPTDRDGVEYFLFVTQKGYCDYFASAMAVLLRSVGIPARVVSGYATGQAQGDGIYLVRDSHAHSWTEVYFPGYGWIPFDPSAGFPTPPRGVVPPPSTTQPVPPTPASQAAPITPGPVAPTPVADNGSGEQPVSPVSPLAHAPDLSATWPYLGGLGLLGLAGLAIRRFWEKDLRQLPPPVVAYVKMTRLARILGVRRKESLTPREYADRLGHALPEAAEAIGGIADQYGEHVYGRPTAPPRHDPAALWLRLRRHLMARIVRLGRRKG